MGLDSLVNNGKESEPEYSQVAPKEAYWTPERLELYHWLLLRAPEIANVYAGALHMVESGHTVPGREHFVAHAARELWNGVVELVLGPDGSTRPADRFQKIVKIWGGSEQCSSSENGIEIPCTVFEEVDQTVREYKARQKPRQKNVRMLQEMIGPSVPEDELEPEAKKINEIHRRFVRAAHVNREKRNIDWDDTVTEFRYIENVIRSTTRPSSSIRKEIDEILEQANN